MDRGNPTIQQMSAERLKEASRLPLSWRDLYAEEDAKRIAVLLSATNNDNIGELRAISGYLYDEPDDNTHRLYLNPNLTEWVDATAGDVKAVKKFDDHAAPFGRVTMWVRAGARVKRVQHQAVDAFLEGFVVEKLIQQSFVHQQTEAPGDLKGFLQSASRTAGRHAYDTVTGPCY